MQPYAEQSGRSAGTDPGATAGGRGAGRPGDSGDGPASRVVPVRELRRARGGLIAFFVLLIEFLVIVAGANQWVTDRLARQGAGTLSVKRGLIESLATFAWRFSPRGGSDAGHLWLSVLLLDATVLVLGPLLVLAVVRGPVTFFRAFFGIWTAVLAAVIAGSVVRGFVVDVPGQPGPNRTYRAMFGTYGPIPFVVWAGLGLGLLAAVISAIIAVATRRTPSADEPDAAAETSGPVPNTFFDDQPNQRYAAATPAGVQNPGQYPGGQYAGAPYSGAQYGQGQYAGGPTGSGPSAGGPSGGDPSGGAASEPTTQFPSVPATASPDEPTARRDVPRRSADPDATAQLPVTEAPTARERVAEERTGPVADQRTERVAGERTGPVADERTGPVADGRTGPVAQEQTQEFTDQRTGRVADERTGPVADERTDRVAQRPTDQPTAQFPRPPDDEDLHVDDE